MQESFLHYIWQHQYFDKQNLRTAQDEDILILHPGNRNTHAGPDFFNARIKIDGIEWVGSVEIHINASGWTQHRHHSDAAYENVVLHVVWKNDKPARRGDQTILSTIELKNRVDEQLLIKCNSLINSPEALPCSGILIHVPEVIKISMLDSALLHRLESKAGVVLEMLQRNNNDWEETCYQLLCKNFGFKVNTDPFLQLARSLPYKILLKHADNLLQMEALLFGQAGFLEEKQEDAYYDLLRREHSVLSHKYQLSEKKLNKAQWRFLRLRPANFPTIRIAQLAALLHRRKNIFSSIVSCPGPRELKAIFITRQSEYWLHHYQFFKAVPGEIPGLGETSTDNIIINTVAPMLTAYGKARDEQIFIDRAMDVLSNVSAESNSITRQWNALGMNVRTAFDSQALIGLHNDFCLRRRCLDCKIGATLVKPALV